METPHDTDDARYVDLIGLLSTIPGAVDILHSAPSPDDAAQGVADLLKGMGYPLSEISDQYGGPPPILVGKDGQARWNPLIESWIIERSSIDGDVPEFRTGPMPEGATPAIPVKTQSIDTVFVGLQIRHTSLMAASMLALAAEEHRAMCDKMIEDGRRAGLLPVAAEPNLPLPPAPTGIDGYEAGRIPALWNPEPVPPHLPARLSDDEAAEMSWLAFATTQGRRSLAPVIEQRVADAVPQCTVALRGIRPKDAHTVVWSMQAFGPLDLNPRANPAASAVAAFTSTLTIAGIPSPTIVVQPFSEMADRRFGWVLYYWNQKESTHD